MKKHRNAKGAVLAEATLVLPLFILMVFVFFRFWIYQYQTTRMLGWMNDAMRKATQESFTPGADYNNLIVANIIAYSSGKIPTSKISICPLDPALTCGTTGGRTNFFIVKAEYTNFLGQRIRAEVMGIHV